jgi:hypothetical protein
MRNFSTVVANKTTYLYTSSDPDREFIIGEVAKHAQIRLSSMTPAEERTISELRSWMDHVDRDPLCAPSIYVNVNLNTGAVSAVVKWSAIG